MKNDTPTPTREDYPGLEKDVQRDPGHRLQYERPLLAGMIVVLVACLIVGLLYLIGTSLQP